MKHLALALSFVSAAPLLSSALSEPASGPRPGTAEAMQCLVGDRPDYAQCKTMFVGGAQTTATPWLFVSAEQKFQRGGLVSSSFWGRASESNMFDVKAMRALPTREMDIFDVKFAHTEYTFYVSPADAQGKIRALRILFYKPHDPFQVSEGH